MGLTSRSSCVALASVVFLSTICGGLCQVHGFPVSFTGVTNASSWCIQGTSSGGDVSSLGSASVEAPNSTSDFSLAFGESTQPITNHSGISEVLGFSPNFVFGFASNPTNTRLFLNSGSKSTATVIVGFQEIRTSGNAQVTYLGESHSFNRSNQVLNLTVATNTTDEYVILISEFYSTAGNGVASFPPAPNADGLALTSEGIAGSVEINGAAQGVGLWYAWVSAAGSYRIDTTLPSTGGGAVLYAVALADGCPPITQILQQVATVMEVVLPVAAAVAIAVVLSVRFRRNRRRRLNNAGADVQTRPPPPPPPSP